MVDAVTCLLAPSAALRIASAAAPLASIELFNSVELAALLTEARGLPLQLHLRRREVPGADPVAHTVRLAV
jgi:hypothetical protein